MRHLDVDQACIQSELDTDDVYSRLSPAFGPVSSKVAEQGFAPIEAEWSSVVVAQKIASNISWWGSGLWLVLGLESGAWPPNWKDEQ